MVTLIGEIVGSNCYLGVMNPGNGKVHRDCAVRCISGGIPPSLVVRDASGETRIVVLAGPRGRSLANLILNIVAEPATISGELFRHGNTLVLHTEQGAIQRVHKVE